MSDDRFVCVICQRAPDNRWSRDGRDRHVAPICRSCEQLYASGNGAPAAGSFMDRRKVMQIAALAEALRNRASIIKWERRHARA